MRQNARCAANVHYAGPKRTAKLTHARREQLLGDQGLKLIAKLADDLVAVVVKQQQLRQRNERGGSTSDVMLERLQEYIHRVGQDRIYTPYMTVYLMISLPKIPYMYRTYMVLANPIHTARCQGKE